MSDAQIIQSAYAETLSKLFAVFFDALSASGGNSTAATQAADDFGKGIALARKARDQALQLVQ
ncbi:MAG TPA: hypothetical protein VKV22_03975 [Rhodanobacteraceae bacterium]|nr:hypothetical protein [Rhodanobacteraceae bacterium]